jgi:hypothetical protein
MKLIGITLAIGLLCSAFVGVVTLKLVTCQ